MADTVQVMMEKMIPELEDLQDKKLFSQDEIHQIVERRRDFEYAMKRIPLRKIDALRYIEYELNVDALRQRRKDRSGLQKPSISDTTGLKRVHSIFDRVLYKHRGSLDLWLQYIAFCQAERSSRVLANVFSRALQSHPRSPELWIEAASYEFSTNLNIDAARVLLQRAIRLNVTSKRLWHEYFRLELLYIQKLTVRREVLQLDVATAAPVESTTTDATTVMLDELPEEKDAPAVDVATTSDKQRARSDVLHGAIPRIVFVNAIAAIADDVAFRLAFVDIAQLFERAAFVADLCDFILATCVRDFPTSALVLAVQAQRAFTRALGETSVAVAEQRAVACFEAHVAALDTVEIVDAFANWLVVRLATTDKSDWLVAHAADKLERLATRSSAAGVQFVDFVHRTDGTAAALASVQQLLATPLHTHSAVLHLLHAQLVLHQPQDDPTDATAAATAAIQPKPKRRRVSHDGGSNSKTTAFALIDASLAVLDAALTTMATANDEDGTFALSTRWLELLVSEAHASTTQIEAAFQRALALQQPQSQHWSALRQQLIAWAATSFPSIASVRALYQPFFSGQMLPTPATRAFLLLCVDVEASAVAANVDVRATRSVFEKLVDLFPRDDSVWIAYIQFFADRALFTDAVTLHQRAMRACRDSTRLAQLAITGGGSQ